MPAAPKSLRARAVDLLSRREYSRRELERRLAPHADSAEELAALLDELAERRWQSDERFAEQFAEVRGRKYGSRRLQQEMRERGLSADTISSALQDQDDEALARELWRKKFGSPAASREEKARQVRFLAARGIPMGIISRVVNGAGDDFPPDD